MAETYVYTTIRMNLDVKKEVCNHLINKFGMTYGQFGKAIEEGLRLWLEKEKNIE
jgi:translation initiation factor 2 alpha subunit (eIF-2alpha)